VLVERAEKRLPISSLDNILTEETRHVSGMGPPSKIFASFM
jgi:hypothetical protein